MCAFTQDNDNYYVNPWLRTCAFSASRIYIYSPEDENEDSGLVLFSLSLFWWKCRRFYEIVIGFLLWWWLFIGLCAVFGRRRNGRSSWGSMVTLLFKMCARASTGNGRKRGASSISLSVAPLPCTH